MKIENINEGINIAQQIAKKRATIEDIEGTAVLSLKIDLQFTGGRRTVLQVCNGTYEYKKIAEIIIAPELREIELLQKEYKKIDEM